MKQKLFNRDFTMVVIGQIISLFGNEVLRYALPLYLLNQTHSPALFGAVSACAFIPMVLFSPVGGIVADRVNKRNVMVILDFSTAAIVAVYALIMGSLPLVLPLIVLLMLLYGIAGAYQPAVQASLPVLETTENLNSANAVINMVASLSALIGPVLGGVVYVALGIEPVLYISAVCFVCSAVMEIFIHIPFTKQEKHESVFKMVKSDMGTSMRFITKDSPIFGKVGLLLFFINLVFSALIMIGLPIIVTEYLDFPKETANSLYSYSLAALAAGGLAGGLIAGILGRKLNIRHAHYQLFFCTLTLIPIAFAVAFPSNPMLSYIIIVVSCVVMMIFSTIFSVQMLSYGQKITPESILGKVMALVTCLCLFAHPIGQLMYGLLFQELTGSMYLIFLGAFVICLLISLYARHILKEVEEI